VSSSPLELFQLLVHSPAWPALRLLLHVSLLLSVVLLLKGLFRLAREGGGSKQRRGKQGAQRWPSPALLGLGLAFVLVLVHQATWQLTGLFRPELVQFMQSHDRRQFNPAHRIQRGRILDRTGVVLAASREGADGKVRRVYPMGPVFAHAVGYSDPRYGVTGAEAAANTLLNGADSEQLATWVELGRQVITGDERPRGQDLLLTLDAQLQLTAARGLGKRHGAAVLLRVDDGAVLALVSSPGFDPNRLGSALFRGADPATPLLNRATQGLYPPGSTFKVVLAALAMERGFRGKIHCPARGYTTSAKYPRIRDHAFSTASGPWRGGNLDLATALTHSSNVFFAKLGVRLGHDALAAAGRDFHFDQRLRLYPGSDPNGVFNTGRMPRLSSRDLYGLAQVSIGQGRVLATPIHMATIAAAVANAGLAMRPRLIAHEPPDAMGRFMQPATATRLARMMRRVVTEGTARSIADERLAIAGKTGTAENPRGKSHSWFIGFAPAAAPELAVAVLVEHGGYGSKAAAPIARDLLLEGLGRGTDDEAKQAP